MERFQWNNWRLPYEEGCRPAAHLSHAIFHLMQANKHKAAEASEVVLGAVHVVQNAVTSLLPSYYVIMQTDVLSLGTGYAASLSWLMDCIPVESANGVHCVPTLSDIGMQLDVIPQLLLFGL